MPKGNRLPMRLTSIAIRAITLGSSGMKSKLAIALRCSEGTINRYIRENDDNLTKAAALLVIQDESGLREGELLEEVDFQNTGSNL